MAVQFLPIIKAVAPYLAQVATAAIPAFTRKPAEVKTDPVVTQQIEELQQAATQNAESVHILAEQLQQVIQSLEKTGQQAQKNIATYKLMIGTSLVISLVSLGTCIYLLVNTAS